MSINESSYSDLSLQNHEQPKHTPQNQNTNELSIRLYWRRWFILAIFCCFIILNSFNLTEYLDVEEALITFYVSKLINDHLECDNRINSDIFY